MNIQLPVVLWTIICFLILMAVLRNLLFKPVLAMIDSRKEKTARALEKKEEEKKQLLEHENRLRIISEDARIQRENYIKSELELIRIKNRTETEKAKAQRLIHVEQYKEVACREKEEIINAFELSSDKIAAAFADKLISR